MAEYTEFQAIQMAQLRAEIVATQAKAIRTLAEAQQHGAKVYDRRHIVEAVTSGDLNLLTPNNTEENKENA